MNSLAVEEERKRRRRNHVCGCGRLGGGGGGSVHAVLLVSNKEELARVVNAFKKELECSERRSRESVTNMSTVMSAETQSDTSGQEQQQPVQQNNNNNSSNNSMLAAVTAARPTPTYTARPAFTY